MITTVEQVMDTPLGPLRLVASGRGICKVAFVPDTVQPTGGREADDTAPATEDGRRILDMAAGQLTEYFAGERTVFTVPLDLSGTGFQRAVWQQLSTVRFGQVVAYGDLAVALGNPAAQQAVGAANGRNPVAIIVPCHRVVGRNGNLTGYAGGIERKKWLLRHEMATLF
ncbi:methylated-DNA-[protein]-cysteine S-methyltransferase [Neolewinella xylanilytica]|uniref:Methylated-DNA--protein-cysteine methyltransferase n=1 Tax=Neolewinella xylanilytica TaxID=1514080 RepID=A0A2S6I6X1_9BACT|nr:methylated-DNA--[protein]-cysteine S-methyltransferase [Neolewinella xylanilytica]PPK87238.1 methylated-DNA-[protein]-cysteine S-methyltransferase [Neolewinella xylanilytica]